MSTSTVPLKKSRSSRVTINKKKTNTKNSNAARDSFEKKACSIPAKLISTISRNNCLHIDAAENPTDFASRSVNIVKDNGLGIVFHLNGSNDSNDCREYLKIHPLKRYKLSLWIKGDRDCGFNICIKCFNAAGTPITDYDMHRGGRPVVVRHVIQEDDAHQILVCDRAVQGWRAAQGNKVHYRCLGFYFDGNDKVVPDAYLKHSVSWDQTDANGGAYNKIDGRLIYLSHPMGPALREQIVNDVSVVRNHWGGNTYMYPFLNQRTSVKDGQWHHIETVITGSCSERKSRDNRFRLSTQYIKIGLYTMRKNLWFNHFKFEEISSQ